MDNKNYQQLKWIAPLLLALQLGQMAMLKFITGAKLAPPALYWNLGVLAVLMLIWIVALVKAPQR